MAVTTNITITPAQGWLLVASSPGAITVKSNEEFFKRYSWAIASSAPSASSVGNVEAGGVSFESNGFAGNLYVKVFESHIFAVTV